jgi:hypothetical protein
MDATDLIAEPLAVPVSNRAGGTIHSTGWPVIAAMVSKSRPPEGGGGTGGYEKLIDTLADPRQPGHDHLLQWLGIEKGTDFDPARCKPADNADRRLDTVVLAASRTN